MSFRERDDAPPMLLPLIDVANSVSTGATARVEFGDGVVHLRSSFALDAGDEVTVCYDEDGTIYTRRI